MSDVELVRGHGEFEARLTIAIPHYKEPALLEGALKSIFDQDLRASVVILDDGSGDDAVHRIEAFLDRAGAPGVRLYRRRANVGFGRNVLDVLRLAQSEYVMLLGQDDALAAPTFVRELLSSLDALDCPDVAVVSFHDTHPDAGIGRRAVRTTVGGAGPEVALRSFRSFGFMSGLVALRQRLDDSELDAFVGSIFLQVAVWSRIIAAGGRFATVQGPEICRGIEVDGSRAATWADNIRLPGAVARHNILPELVLAASGAVTPFSDKDASFLAAREVLLFSVPDALVGYRAAGGLRVGASFAWSSRPTRLLPSRGQSRSRIVLLWIIWLGVTAAGVAPPRLMRMLQGRLAPAVRTLRAR